MANSTIIRQHRMMRCEKCGQIFKLAHRTAGVEVDGTLRTAMLTPCPHCDHIARQPVAGGRGWSNGHMGGAYPTEKADRIQSTMRYDKANYDFINNLARETELSVADLMNAFVAFFRYNRSVREAVVAELQAHEAERS